MLYTFYITLGTCQLLFTYCFTVVFCKQLWPKLSWLSISNRNLDYTFVFCVFIMVHCDDFYFVYLYLYSGCITYYGSISFLSRVIFLYYDFLSALTLICLILCLNNENTDSITFGIKGIVTWLCMVGMMIYVHACIK